VLWVRELQTALLTALYCPSGHSSCCGVCLIAIRLHWVRGEGLWSIRLRISSLRDGLPKTGERFINGPQSSREWALEVVSHLPLLTWLITNHGWRAAVLVQCCDWRGLPGAIWWQASARYAGRASGGFRTRSLNEIRDGKSRRRRRYGEMLFTGEPRGSACPPSRGGQSFIDATSPHSMAGDTSAFGYVAWILLQFGFFSVHGAGGADSILRSSARYSMLPFLSMTILAAS